MKVSHYDANIVILALNHNPSIITKDWLFRNNIIKEPPDDFSHTPFRSFVTTPTYHFSIEQRRLFLELNDVNDDSLPKLPGVAIRYIETLPQIPYNAMGFNFRYKVNTTPKEDMLRSIFVKDEKLMETAFEDKYKVGGILQSYYKDFEVTLTATPEVEVENTVDMNFNYTSIVQNVEELADKLEEFLSAINHSKRVTSNLMRGDA